MAVYVLRDETLTGSGDLVGEIEWTRYGNGVTPPEDPTHDGQSWGSLSIPGAGSFTFDPHEIVNIPTPPSSQYTYEIGWRVVVTDAVGGTTTDDGLTTYTPSGKQYISIDSTGDWEISIDCQLCLEVTKPSIPSGTGSNAVNFMPDPPHGVEYRLFYRTRNGGSYSIEVNLGSASASRSGTFASSTELAIPDYVDAEVEAFAEQLFDDSAFSINGKISGTWRGAQIDQNISASGTHGSAYANNTDGVKVTATCVSDAIGDVGSAYSQRFLAVPLEYSLDAQLRAMEVSYPDTLTLEYERAGTTVDVTASGGAYTDTSREYRYESSEVWVKDGTTVEDEEDYTLASNWGAISIGIKSSSASTESEPTADLKLLLKDRKMDALSIETPEKSDDLAGTDTALGGTPWGVQRSYTGNTPPWQGLMGWRYLEVIVAETGGAAAGAAVTIKIGSKSWTKDSTGAAITAPGSGNSATWVIDLCSPSSETAATDATDTTYPYSQDWTADGGNEDSYPRTGTGPYAGPTYATTIRIEVGSSRTFTITSIKGKRTVTNTIYCTNLPTHNAWIEQRPATVVSEADTTTYHKIRQSYEVDLEGRLIAAEWSDTEWDTTVGGASGVYTHTLYERSIEWLAGRINAATLCPKWSSTIAAASVGTGSAAWYNREREVHGILGGGYWWKAPAGATPGSWQSGIDATQRTNADGALTLPWQGGFTRLSNCPGNVGDVFQHANSGTTGALTLKAAKILRTQGVGLSLTSAGLNDTSSTLTLTQASTARGTGATNSDGYAQTGTPFGRGAGGDITLDFDGGTGSTYQAKARKRRHFRAKGLAEAGCVSIDTAPNQRVAYALDVAGTLRLYFAAGPDANLWEEVVTTVGDVDCVAIAYDKASAIGRLWIVIDKTGGGIAERYTDDEGMTVSVATTINSAGKNASVATNPLGKRLIVFTDGSDLKRQVRDAQDNVITAVSTIVTGGVADAKTAVTWRLGKWYILYGNTSGAVVEISSIDDGESFS